MTEREKPWTQDEIDEDMFSADDPDDCDCVEADEDILTGRVQCFRCGRVWYADGETINKEDGQ